MLLLSILFTSVSLLFIYCLMRDTGKNTPHARRSNILNNNLSDSAKQSENRAKPVSPISVN